LFGEPKSIPDLAQEDYHYVRRTRTDPTGRFSFTGVPAGSYILLWRDHQVRKVISLQEGQVLEVKLKGFRESMFQGRLEDHSGDFSSPPLPTGNNNPGFPR
jgi:hypothetical protein